MRLVLLGVLQGNPAIGCFRDNFDVGLRFEQHAQALPHRFVILDEQDANRSHGRGAAAAAIE